MPEWAYITIIVLLGIITLKIIWKNILGVVETDKKILSELYRISHLIREKAG